MATSIGNNRIRTLSTWVIATLVVTGCTQREQSVATRIAPVPKVASCSEGDHPETALQGQVPAALRASGFNGFNCNLRLSGQFQGEGGGWSGATFKDDAGHTCAFYGTGYVKNALTGAPIERRHSGVAVIDITDPAHPTQTASLITAAMMDPWESLRVNLRRKILVADGSVSLAGGSPYVDLYDISEDCRTPKLLASTEVGTGKDGGQVLPKTQSGHEGSFAPDGQTYYVGDLLNGTYNAIDIADLTKPKLIAHFDMRTAPLAVNTPKHMVVSAEGKLPLLINGTSHGLSLSTDGNRGYFTAVGYADARNAVDPKFKTANGFYVVDTSDVQARKPNPTMKLIATVPVRGGTMSQHALRMTVKGKPFLVFVDEGGAVQGNDLASPPDYLADATAACNAGLSPFPMAHIFDLSDERNPKEVSVLALETHDPGNCNKVLPDLAGLWIFTYGSHYCSVDNRDNATALACAFFNSGIRVFDIRDPVHPKEIAYYNPAGSRRSMPGSIHGMLTTFQSGAPDWCTSRPDFDFDRHMLTAMCMDNGLLAMEFENGVWPMPESSRSEAVD